jgi:excisionase family DNA binding protein
MTDIGGPIRREVRHERGLGVETMTSSNDSLAERLAYSVDEVAAVTGLSRDLLYDQMRAGKLAYLKVGRRRIITRQHLEAFLARQAS